MRAFADENGTLYVLYRAATEQIRRDTVLLVSRDHGKHFVADRVAKWDLDACPMTTNFISQTGRKISIAWEPLAKSFMPMFDPARTQCPSRLPRRVPDLTASIPL
jgi:hypothetical protein